MICQINKFNFKVASIVLATFFTSISWSQEAEKLFKEQYSKLTFVLQPSYLVAGDARNLDGSVYPSMKMTKDFSHQFGFYYNAFQFKNFNIKTGLIAKEYIPKYDLNVTDQDINLGIEGLLTDIETFNQFILSVPVNFDFFIPITTKWNAVVGGGCSFNFFTGYFDEELYKVIISNETESKDIYSAKINVNQKLTFSTQISAGFNYKAKFALIQLEAVWNKNSFSIPQDGKYTIYNLAFSPDKKGTIALRDNFYGLSLQVTPKKGWLKRK